MDANATTDTQDNVTEIRPGSGARRPKITLKDIDPDMVPRRHFDIYSGEKTPVSKSQFGLLAKFFKPSRGVVERSRQLSLVGDPLADDFAALYPTLGYAKARAMLDTALEQGIEHVDNPPPELVALFKELDSPPMWLDWRLIEKGAAVMRRYAPLSWLTMRLAFSQTYINANAGLPLFLTGSLTEKTVARRLKETSKWRMGIQMPGAMKRFGEGFKTVVRVRILHALVRNHLINHPEWDVQQYGMPIPQLDMCGANVGMMATHSQALRMFGARISGSEMEAVLHFWRYHGHVIGVIDELNPTTTSEFLRLFSRLAILIRFKFDRRAAVLTQATFNARMREGEGRFNEFLDFLDRRISTGLFQLQSGKSLYHAMGMGGSKGWPYAFAAVFPFVFAMETARKYTPGASKMASDIGQKIFETWLDDEIVQNAPFKPYHMMAQSS